MNYVYPRLELTGVKKVYLQCIQGLEFAGPWY